jgi:uncharacterized protein (DUF433 family)
MDTTLLNRITINPAVLTGKPVVRGMRISVEQIIKMLARGISHSAIIEEYPLIEEDDIKGCLLFAALIANSGHNFLSNTLSLLR